LPARVTPAEARRLPKFGVCQPAGLGSWALSLTNLSGNGDGPARTLSLELAVVHVDLEGGSTSAPFGSLEVAPGGLEVGPLRVYDYDDDGRDELIVPYEIKAPALGAAPAAPSALWSLAGSAIVPYKNAPALTGGATLEQLDYDMRPDLGSYGPFVAWLPPACGAKNCIPRITGPKFFFHSLVGGNFSASDEAARAAVQRECAKKPSAVVVVGPNGVNLTKTAENLGCARVRGESVTELRAELDAKHSELCGEQATCPLAAAFETWLSAALPDEPPASQTAAETE
jgi:hypothetical protein